MKVIVFLSALVVGQFAFAQANFSCEPVSIQEWPFNPSVTVTQVSKNTFEVSAERSFYGAITGETFKAKAVSQSEDTLILSDGKSALTLMIDGQNIRGLLESKDYGKEKLVCKKL